MEQLKEMVNFTYKIVGFRNNVNHNIPECVKSER